MLEIHNTDENGMDIKCWVYVEWNKNFPGYQNKFHIPNRLPEGRDLFVFLFYVGTFDYLLDMQRR